MEELDQAYYELEEYPFNPDECGICGDDPCSCFDDLCCYDPRYTGPKDYCACGAEREEYEKSQKTYWRIANWLKREYRWIKWKLSEKYRDIFNIKDNDLPF